MPKRLWPKIKDFLHLSNSETKGAFVLLIIIAAVIIFNLTTPFWIKRTDHPINKDLAEEVTAFKELMESTKEKKAKSENSTQKNKFHTLSAFNPNTVSEDNLLQMGFPSRVARTLINYRNAGGVFITKNDLLKVYGIDNDALDKLYAYILLPEKVPESNITKDDEKPSEIEQTGKSSKASELTVEINSASAEELQKLSGIGPAYSERIVKYRNLLGGFYSTDQLHEVYNLPEETVKSISEFLSVDTSLIEKISLKNLDGEEGLYHPYLTKKQQSDLYLYLKTMKEINSAEELLKNNILDEKTLNKIKPYLGTN